MKRSLLISFFYCLLTVYVNGQYVFNNRYDWSNYSNGTNNIIWGNDSNYIMSMISVTPGILNLTTVNKTGQQILQKNYAYHPGFSFYDGNGGSLNIANNSYYLAGTLDYNNATNDDSAIGYLAKFDNNLDTLFLKIFRSQHGLFLYNSIVDPQRNIIISVGFKEISSSTNKLLILITDTLGNLIAEKSYGTSGYWSTGSICFTNDKGFAVAGYYSNGPNGGYDGVVLKYDSLYNFKWIKYLGGQYNDGASVSSYITDSTILITHVSDNYLIPGNGNTEYFQTNFITIDYNGNVKKTRSMRHAPNTGVSGPSVIKNNFIYWAGQMTQTQYGGTNSGWLLKTSLSGDSIESHYYRIFNQENYFRDIDATPDGGFVMAGFGWDSSGVEDAWIVKIDSMGCADTACILSGVKDVNDKITDPTFRLYPNPNNGNFVIEVTDDKKLHYGLIYDKLGRVVSKTETFVNQLEISNKELVSGNYWLIVFAEGQLCSKMPFVIIEE